VCFAGTWPRLKGMGQHSGDEVRAARLCFKCLQLAQIVFGERTVDKLRLLPLYNKCVPPFPTKVIGELMIRNYLGSMYPDHPPPYEAVAVYKEFFGELWKVVRNGLAR